jgi:phosphate/sulfate permease
MGQYVIYLGFFIAAYAVIANDVIQTLGTFIASNSTVKWWLLWVFAGSILTITLFYGWYTYAGDVSYGRLSQIPLPDPMPWWYLLAPISLLVITRFGIPASTTFMILSVFSSSQLIEKMILKSVLGYSLAFVVAFFLYLFITKKFESAAAIRLMDKKKQRPYWLVAQWFSTGFLWSQWLIQDFANIFVFLPRQLNMVEILLSLALILIIMAYIFNTKGGKIQGIVNQKSNTQHIRSATIIDTCYGLLLLFFTTLNTIPMSTTWAFVGILAGREIAINYLLKKDKLKKTYRIIVKDFAKVNIGLFVSILIAYLIQFLKA